MLGAQKRARSRRDAGATKNVGATHLRLRSIETLSYLFLQSMDFGFEEFR